MIVFELNLKAHTIHMCHTYKIYLFLKYFFMKKKIIIRFRNYTWSQPFCSFVNLLSLSCQQDNLILLFTCLNLTLAA